MMPSFFLLAGLLTLAYSACEHWFRPSAAVVPAYAAAAGVMIWLFV